MYHFDLDFQLFSLSIHERFKGITLPSLLRSIVESLRCRLFQLGVVVSKKYRGLTILMLVSNSVHAGCGAIYLYYIQGHFGKDLKDIAPIIMLNGINNLLVQIFVVKYLARCLSVRGIILLGYVFGALNCALLSFLPNFYYLYIMAVTSGLGVIFAPAIQALYMNSAQPEEMGKVQGAVNSVVTITAGLGPKIFSQVLAASQTFSHHSTWKGSLNELE